MFTSSLRYPWFALGQSTALPPPHPMIPCMLSSIFLPQLKPSRVHVGTYSNFISSQHRHCCNFIIPDLFSFRLVRFHSHQSFRDDGWRKGKWGTIFGTYFYPAGTKIFPSQIRTAFPECGMQEHSFSPVTVFTLDSHASCHLDS